MANKGNPKLALMLTSRIEAPKYGWQAGDGDRWYGVAELVTLSDDGSPRNIQNSWFDNTMGYEGFRVEATLSTQWARQDGARSANWDVKVKTGGDATLRDIAEMGKVAARIKRAMDKDNETLGQAATFGAFVLRFARALGVKDIVLANGPMATHSYSETSWLFVGSGAAEWMDTKLAEFVASKAGVTA